MEGAFFLVVPLGRILSVDAPLHNLVSKQVRALSCSCAANDTTRTRWAGILRGGRWS